MSRIQKRTDKDQLYKVLLQNFFKEFVDLFLPFFFSKLDFTKTEFLLQEMFTDIPRGSRKQLDLVVKVKFKGKGDEKVIIIHIEVEAQKNPGISKRMFKYFAQLYLRYEMDVIPIVIFADDHKWKKPIDREYKIKFDETYLAFHYKKIKLKELDYRKYLTGNNPLAYALMVKMGFDKKERLKVKAEALRLILTTRVNEAKQSILINFINESMVLNQEDERKFSKMIDQNKNYDEVKEMITTYEEKGIKKGIEKGIEKGMQILILKQIEKRFGSLSPEIEKHIKAIKDSKKLDQLGLELLDIKNLDELKCRLTQLDPIKSSK